MRGFNPKRGKVCWLRSWCCVSPLHVYTLHTFRVQAIRTSLTNNHVIPSTHSLSCSCFAGRAFGISAPSFVFHRLAAPFVFICFGTGFWPLRSLIMPPQHTNGSGTRPRSRPCSRQSRPSPIDFEQCLSSARSSNQPWGSSVGDRRGDRAHDNPSGLHPLGCYDTSVGVAMNACLQHACI